MKTLLLLAFVLSMLLFALGWRSDEPAALAVASTPRESSFAVKMVKPRLDRPLLGLVPEEWLREMDPTPSELRFDHTSPGARGTAGARRLELHADGWGLLLEVDDEGRAGPAPHVVLPADRAGGPRPLRCRPPRRADADLRATQEQAPGSFDGSFRFQLAACEVAATGTAVDWPSMPLTVSGRFTALPPVGAGSARY
jgi:hypothetical protein